MTYSIVARDPDTGQLGVAVQSHYFSVGSVVPWVEAGVGAVATQALGEISYGPLGLDSMRNGRTVEETLQALVLADAKADQRQVGMVDGMGKVAAHTGDRCIAYAGHLTAPGVTVQANMMERDTVPSAMLGAYNSASGPLAGRLLAALDAAEAEGGDIRGKQSAAMVIADGTRHDKPWKGRLLELRIEDHPEPLAELRRLAQLHRAYSLMNESEEAATSGDWATATDKVMEAMQLAPGNAEIAFWAAIGSAAAGQLPVARQLLARSVAADERWKELVRRLPAAGLADFDDEVVRQLTED